MAHVFEVAENESSKANNIQAMKLIQVKIVADYYKANKEGLEVNDGMFLNYIDDREEIDESKN